MNYWPLFESFCRGELEAHGPDHQLELLLELAPNVSDIEKVWLAGCYCSHHCVASAFAVWSNFRPHEILDNPEKLLVWIKQNWYALPVRPEMHSHRMPEKRWECIVDFAIYAIDEGWRHGSYDYTWKDSIGSVRFFNRYLGIKFLELLRRTVRPDLTLSDIRAAQGWSPRTGIAILYPAMAQTIGNKHDNSFETVWIAEEYANSIKKRLKENGVDISYYQLQVMLCNFKQMVQGRLAPGSGHEQERKFAEITAKKFDMTPIFETRKRIFNPRYLSELPEWQGLKKEEWRKRVKEFQDENQI